MLVLLNIIGAIRAAVAAVYQNVYTDQNNVFYTDENNQPYTS
jgi:hypothetical protein